ncbi:MAG TPA: acyl-CoA dehydrogenase family protein [Streptosporangiaceae bacterium]|nr:acyl-CoA dehydrogenase family protein [Streptosporangiaceae bacterium]
MSRDDEITEAGLRAELRRLFDSPAMRRALSSVRQAASSRADPRPVYRLLGEHGLLAPSWPAELGGRAAPAWTMAVIAEELVAHGVPDMVHVVSVQSVGTALLQATARADLRALIRQLGRAESFACVLLTEREAGSDVAALRTMAKPTARGYRLDGIKAYSLGAGQADYGLCLARIRDRDQPLAGELALFLVPMRTPGVRVTGMDSLLDDELFTVELHEVDLPADALIGDRAEGWQLLLRLLTTERTGIDYYARARHWYSAICDLAVSAGTAGRVPASRVSQLGTRLDAARLLAYQSLRQLYEGTLPEVSAAVAKWWTSELAARMAWEGVSAFGCDRAGEHGETLNRALREAPGLLISGGVSEVLLDIVGRFRIQQTGAALCVPADASPLERELRHGVSRGLTSPVNAQQALVQMGALRFGIPVAAGGLDLGQVAVLIVCTELGIGGHPPWHLSNMLAADLLSRCTGNELAAKVLAAIISGSATASVLGLGAPAINGDWTLLIAGDDSQGGGVLALLPADHHLLKVGTADSVHRFDRALLHADWVISDGHVTAQNCAEALPLAKLRLAGYLTGLAAGTLAMAADRARCRTLSGSRLADFPAVLAALAPLYGQVDAVNLLLRETASRHDSGYRIDREAIEVLALSAELSGEATRTALHLHGAAGLTQNHPIQRYYLAAATAAGTYGHPDVLWQVAGEARLREQQAGN